MRDRHNRLTRQERRAKAGANLELGLNIVPHRIKARDRGPIVQPETRPLVTSTGKGRPPKRARAQRT